MADVKITQLHKHYGTVHAVKGVDLSIPDGEFTVLVGPSGCGKSTLLRTIAGLEDAEAGTIEIGGTVVNHVRPRDRDIAMVFQNYALYPYLSVYENIAFGLRARRTPEPEIKSRVGRAAEMLVITPLLERLPRELSGGQRQRVAIGRAIVRNPRVFLFDEPLSNLDAQLRDEMRGEIKRLHQDLGTTMIYVTHDQIEAMTLADRIVLMRDGLIEQQGTPLELFERPRTKFVAGFLGSPQMNFIPVHLIDRGPTALAMPNGHVLPWPPAREEEALSGVRKKLLLGIRPEHMQRASSAPPAPGVVRRSVTIELVQPTGSRTFITLSLGGVPVVAEVAAHDAQRAGEQIDLDIDLNRAILIDASSGKVLGSDTMLSPPPRAGASPVAAAAAGAATTMEPAMSAHEPSLAVKLFGTETVDPKGRTLTAGALTAVLDSGMLRYIRFGDTEVMRAIAFLVRDENWGTFTPEITNLKLAESDGAFAVTYDARCKDAKRSISYQAKITCSADGTLLFNVKAKPDSDFLTNRTGFVVLHPLTGVAGHPVEVEHVDGRKIKSEFPAIISPIQPFYDIRALTHEVQPGLSVTCRMEGDTFEMEDHRNWTDASFKTYVRPLSLPWPYTLPAGQEVSQSVTLTFAGALPLPAVHTGARAIDVQVGDASGTRMPRIGLGLPAEEAAPSLAVADLIRAACIDTLIAQFDGRSSDNAATTANVAKLAAATGAGIVAEIILPAKTSPADELAPIAHAIRAAGLALTAVTVSPAPHLKAVLPGSKGPDVPPYEALYAAARAEFPGVPLGGGMYSFFTELNRNPPPAELLDFVTHTTSPIVHAADDISVMETLEALPYVIQSTRALIKGKPYRVGPSAIPARDNPYGAASADNPNNGRVCLAKMDPRQRGLFGAAWTLGYIAAFAKGGIDVVSIGAPTGPAGIIARKTDYRQPHFDGLGDDTVYPLYHVISGLAPAAGCEVLATTVSRGSAVAALAIRTARGVELWLANLTNETEVVSLKGLGGGQVRSLSIDASSFVMATQRPSFLADAGRVLIPGEKVILEPYAVVRVTAAQRRI